jgi:hypothetical protein
MADTNTNLLAKAHNVVSHLAKIHKAVSSFHDGMTKLHQDHMEHCVKLHKAAEEEGLQAAPAFHEKMGKLHKAHCDKMCKLHKAHRDDMHKAIGQLHKLVGVDPAPDAEGTYANHGTSSNEPVGRDLMGDGTVNLQDFGGNKPEDVGKTVKTQLQPQNGNGSVTKTELADMLKGLMEQFEAKIEASTLDMAKALFEPVDVVTRDSMPNAPQLIQGNHQQPVQKTAVGVGDRNNLAQPVAQVVTNNNVSKSGDNGTQTQQTNQPVRLTPDMAKAAIEGSDEEKIAFMRTALPQEVPATLIAPLSKIHS